MENKKIKAAIIFEMMGRPPEHLKETMGKLLDTIGSEKGVNIIKRKIHEIKKIENKDSQGNPIVKEGELYSTFSEIEIEAEGVMVLLLIAFKYMPAHIEVIYPESYQLDNIDLNTIINEILAKVHNYDAIAKSALMNNQVLANKLKEMMQQQNPQMQNNASQGIPMKISYGKEGDKKEEKKKAKPAKKAKKK